MQYTNLKNIKEIAIQLIYIKPEPIEDSGFYKHPYISHPVIMLLDTNESFNIFQDIEKYYLWQEEFADNIRHMRNAYSVACLIKTYYRSVFLSLSKNIYLKKILQIFCQIIGHQLVNNRCAKNKISIAVSGSK